MRTPIEIAKAGAKVIISGAYSLLDTNFGLQVKFDGVHHLEITVPGKYFDKVRSAVLLLPLCSFSPLFIILRSDSQRQFSFRSVPTGIQIFLKCDIIQGPSHQSNIAPNPARLSILPGRLLLPSKIPGVNYRVSTG